MEVRDGLVKAWGEDNPTLRFEPGDRITEVNGKKLKGKDLVDALHQEEVFELKVQPLRKEPSKPPADAEAPASPPAGKSGGTGAKLPPGRLWSGVRKRSSADLASHAVPHKETACAPIASSSSSCPCLPAHNAEGQRAAAAIQNPILCASRSRSRSASHDSHPVPGDEDLAAALVAAFAPAGKYQSATEAQAPSQAQISSGQQGPNTRTRAGQAAGGGRAVD